MEFSNNSEFSFLHKLDPIRWNNQIKAIKCLLFLSMQWNLPDPTQALLLLEIPLIGLFFCSMPLLSLNYSLC